MVNFFKNFFNYLKTLIKNTINFAYQIGRHVIVVANQFLATKKRIALVLSHIIQYIVNVAAQIRAIKKEIYNLIGRFFAPIKKVILAFDATMYLLFCEIKKFILLPYKISGNILKEISLLNASAAVKITKLVKDLKNLWTKWW